MAASPLHAESKRPQGHSSRQARQLAIDELLSVPKSGHSLAIEHSFPERLVDELSRLEVFNKHLFRPNTYLHKWWARRCGSTFRAILKQFAPDEDRRNYYAFGGLEGKVVLDPMMGGGTTLHEAIRLGANVIGADIDPIPVMQTRASLSQETPENLRASFSQFYSNLYKSLGHYFQTECPSCNQSIDSQYTLHGQRKVCACGEVVQIDQHDLRHETDSIVRICPDSWQIYADDREKQGFAATPRLVAKSEKTCPSCGRKYAELADLPFYRRYAPIAIAAVCPAHGFFFRSPGDSDRARISQADKMRSRLDFGPPDDFKVAGGPKSGDLLRHNIRSYVDLFSSRQLLYIHQSICELQAHCGVSRLNLGMLVSTSLEFNSMMCGYKGWYKRRPGAIRHVFALHAYSFPYTALENNPVNSRKTSGNLQSLYRDRIERGRKWSVLPVERRIRSDGKTELVNIPGETDSGIEVFSQQELTGGSQKFQLIQGDSRNLPIADHSVDLIVTDPPYYDSVQYSDLATFFRVWLTRLLPNEFDWIYDGARSAVATKASGSGFLAALAEILKECGRVLKPPIGRMVFTFHHWDPTAWAELTIALQGAKFRLRNAYVVYSEHPISVHIRNLNSIKHDCILVFSLGSGASSSRWRSLQSIDTSDSETFCRQCGATLGWLLESGFKPSEIRAAWKDLIKENVNAR